MNEVIRSFDERSNEIDIYLDFLLGLEEQVRIGPPKVGDGPTITAVQQRILYSSVYLQLYNLVESTVTKCLSALTAAISRGNQWLPSDLSSELRREWVRYLAQTHTDLSYETRLTNSLKMCNHLINSLPTGRFDIAKGGGGNWDDEEIYRISKRLGCALRITPESSEAAKRPFRDDCGALKLVAKLRNELAHGSVSFSECGSGTTVRELKDLKWRVATYLTDVISSFNDFIHNYGFLQQDRRPTEALS